MEQERLEQLEPKLKALRDEIKGLDSEIGHLDEKHQKTVEEKEELNKMMKVLHGRLPIHRPTTAYLPSQHQ